MPHPSPRRVRICGFRFSLSRAHLLFTSFGGRSAEEQTRNLHFTRRKPPRLETPSQSRASQKRWDGGEEDRISSPSPRGAACFFQVGSCSIDGNAGSGYIPRDLRDRSPDADSSKAGRPEFEIESTGVALPVGGNRIFFVDGEHIRDLTRRRVKH